MELYEKLNFISEEQLYCAIMNCPFFLHMVSINMECFKVYPFTDKYSAKVKPGSYPNEYIVMLSKSSVCFDFGLETVERFAVSIAHSNKGDL